MSKDCKTEIKPKPPLCYPILLSHPYPTILSHLLPFPRIPSPTFLHSHPCHTLAFPTLYPALPYPWTLQPLTHLYSPLYYPSLASPPLPTYPCTHILPLHSVPFAPLASLPSHLLSCPLPYHIPPDRSRGRNVSYPTSLGYLNPCLLYPPLLSQHPHTLCYPSTACLSTPLPLHPIHSAHLPCPNILFYYTLLSSPTVASHLLSSPTSPTIPYAPISSGPLFSTQRFRKSQRPRCLVPECIGAKIIWCKMSFGGLK